jgi:hypothetical protein
MVILKSYVRQVFKPQVEAFDGRKHILPGTKRSAKALASHEELSEFGDIRREVVQCRQRVAMSKSDAARIFQEAGKRRFSCRNPCSF